MKAIRLAVTDIVKTIDGRRRKAVSKKGDACRDEKIRLQETAAEKQGSKQEKILCPLPGPHQ